MNLFYFKIPAGYKNMTNCLIKIIKITFLGRSFCGIFEGGQSGRSVLDTSLEQSWTKFLKNKQILI